jgi:uncharacterized RDD family membrane protein YckC
MLDSLFATPFLYYPLKLIEEAFPLNFFSIFYFPLVAILYYGLIPYFWSGYTPGMRIIGIRIEKDDGSQLTFMNMFMRVLIGFSVYFITLGIALLISVIFSFIKKESRLLHDKLGQTRVLYTNRTDVKANMPITVVSIVFLLFMAFHPISGKGYIPDAAMGLYIIVGVLIFPKVKSNNILIVVVLCVAIIVGFRDFIPLSFL